MVNWKYFLKNAALTAIHAHISLWNGIWINWNSGIASNMLTKYKITVTPNNILMFNLIVFYKE
jgi:hypothetical protein